MGIRRGPNIVRDGLVFAVDAANPSSYVSGSSLWKDQTINQNDGTLVNDPTFNSDDQGSIDFDGADDYMTINNSAELSFDRTTSFTIAGWFNLSANEANAPYWGKWGTNGAESTGNYMIWSGVSSTLPRVVFSVANGTGTAATTPLYTYTRNQWNYWVGIYTSNTKLDFYENGVLQTSVNYTGAINNTETPWTINRATFSGGAQHFTGKSNCLQIYNRALSLNEVLQNYNALKGRFGL